MSIERSYRIPDHRYTAAAERLKDMNYLSSQDRASLLLVAEKMKPAALIEVIWSRGVSAYPEDEYIKNLQEFRLAIEHLGLTFVEREGRREESRNNVFYIGCDQWTADDLAHVQTLVGSAEKYRRTGELLGYPPTAVDAFILDKKERSVLNREDLPPHAQEEFRLHPFAPSRDHWQDELAVVAERNRVLKRVAPFLFE